MAEDVTAAITAGPTKPVLVLAAGEDTVEPLDRVKGEVFARIPGTQFVVLSGSGHLSPLDTPEAVAEHIDLSTSYRSRHLRIGGGTSWRRGLVATVL